MAIRRNINYINKEFSEYRSQLINYSQTYFPTTYTDFTETSPVSLSGIVHLLLAHAAYK